MVFSFLAINFMRFESVKSNSLLTIRTIMEMMRYATLLISIENFRINDRGKL